MALSPNMLKEVFAERSSQTECVLFTMTHADWNEPVRVCSLPYEVLWIDNTTNLPQMGIVSRGKQFIHVGMVPILPTSQDENPPESSIKFSNVSREISQKIKMVSDKYPRVTMEVISTLNADIPEMVYPDMEMSVANWSPSEGEISIKHNVASSEPCPPRTFSITSFANLHVG